MTLPLARIGHDRQLGPARNGNVRLAGHVACAGEPLRSPVSGTLCAYWRLRIVEELEPTLRLVHEMASNEAFEVIETDPRAADGAASRRVRISPSSAEV